MKKEPLFLGTASKLIVDATTDGKHVRFHLAFRESPQGAPIEFVLDARTSMALEATLQTLQLKHNWQIPKSGSH